MKIAIVLVFIAFWGCLAAAAAEPTTRMAVPQGLQGVQRLLFVGDSLTDGSDYPDFVVNTINGACGTHIEPLNAGICGDTSAMVLARLQADVLDVKPDMVVLMIGTNDMARDRTVEQFRTDLGKLVETMLDANIRVVLALPSPLRNRQGNARLEDYLSVIRQTAEKHKLLLVDAHAEFVRQIAAGKEMIGPDGAHHGKDGFAGMARAMLDGLGFKDLSIDTKIHPWPHALTHWEISSPIADANAAKALDPNAAGGWTAFDANAASAAMPWNDAPFPQRGAVMPIVDGKLLKPSFVLGRTTYTAASASKAQMQLGGSGPLVVWLNGKEVWRKENTHGYHPNADRIAVDLVAGGNQVVVLTNYIAFVSIVPQ